LQFECFLPFKSFDFAKRIFLKKKLLKEAHIFQVFIKKESKSTENLPQKNNFK
jgi:hypothetical protein